MYYRIFFALIMLGALVGFIPSAHAISPQEVGLTEGDLVSSYLYDKDPDIFIINQSGYKRLFLNPAIFGFYGHLHYAQVKSVTPGIRDKFITASLYKNCEDNDSKVYALEVRGEDTGALHFINASEQYVKSQDSEFPYEIFCINRQEFNWYPVGQNYQSLLEVTNYRRQNNDVTNTMISPNGGETWVIGKTYTVRWNVVQGVRVALELVSGNATIGYGTEKDLPASTANVGFYSWTIPSNAQLGQYRIRVICAQGCDFSKQFFDDSDAPFTITDHLATDTAYMMEARDTKRIADIDAIKVALVLYHDSYSSYPRNLTNLIPAFLPLEPKDPLDQSPYFYKAFPETCNGSSNKPCTNYHLGVSLEDPANPVLKSDVDVDTTFTPGGFKGDDLSACSSTGTTFRHCYDIVPDLKNIPRATSATPSLILAFPNGGEKLQEGMTYTIQWQSSGISNVYLELTRDSIGGGSISTISGSYLPNTGTYQWTIPRGVFPLGNDYRINLSDASNSTTRTQSSAPFSIIAGTSY